MMTSENQSTQSQVHVTAFLGTEVKRQKGSLNRQSSAYTCEGGSVLTQHQSCDTTVNATLVMGHQANAALLFYRQICSK
jgi:hypothetical protein